MLTPINIGPFEIKEPIMLAPMAGVTDCAFRRQTREFGAGLVVSEMLASRELVTHQFDVRAKANIQRDEGLVSVQIAGREAYWMAEAARVAEDQGAPIIDINMGCPAKKVTNGYSGSALMRDPELALSLIEAVVGATSRPVTLKMRLGWDDANRNAASLARQAEEAGVQMIVVHGRTRNQFYKGVADWRAIREVVDAVNIPVIANGDIVDANSAREALRLSGARGLMIGRAANGAPWRLAQIMASLAGRVFSPPSYAKQWRLLEEFYHASLERYGVDVGVRCMRKHIGWRLDEIPNGKAMRARVMRLDEPAEVLARLRDFYAQLNDLTHETRAA